MRTKRQGIGKRENPLPPAYTGPTNQTDEGEPDPTSDTGSTAGIPVVGMGGSAGSLESFKAFFTAMPRDSGAAFVVIQHLAPAYESMLTELLGQYTRMSVVEAQDAMPMKANCVYVIPPNQYLAIRDGILYLARPVMQHGIRMPIDFFFRSLAEDCRERAVCILFSGAGSDGTLGVRAVRGGGGLSLAQDPQTAPFGDMPRSALATGLVDFMLAPEDMPQTLMHYLRQPYVKGGAPAAVLGVQAGPGSIGDILGLVRARHGCDFRCYKKSMIIRRIERRMGLRRLTELPAYFGFLRQDTDELNQLFRDLLINVTAFFRDAEAFEDLRLQAVAPLVAASQMDDPLRVWVPGCSSGEEAYSLSMMLTEEVAAAGKHCAVQIFATDIDEEALQAARTGIYPESIAIDVGPDRLSKFFIRTEHGYRISEMIRNSVVFAAQDLISDPPFSRMDIVSCRNLLIYLDSEAQAKLIPLFNFALNPGGYLFLGKSEGVGGYGDLFAAVSTRTRLFRRLAPPRPIALDTPILPGNKRALPPAGPAAGRPPAIAYGDVLRQALLGHFAAAVVLVDRKGKVLQFHGLTGKYLDMPASEPTLNLLDMAREGLARKLRAAMHQAIENDRAIVLEQVRVREKAASESDAFARVTVTPIMRRGTRPEPANPEPAEQAEGLLAVIFEDVSRPATVGVEPAPAAESDALVRQLEDELRTTQQDLQSTIEELQASNEELRVANEEVVSTNEELQSTNEELETSKEELQSVNEELTTVNSQLHEKVERLDTANSDLSNFLEATEIATLFLDGDLRIKRFTPAATRLMKLIPSDIGRPISDLSMNFSDYDLTADALAVAGDASVIEREARHADGSNYLVRILPYRTPAGRADGVAVTFADVTRLRMAERHTRLLATVVRDSNDAVLLFDLNGEIQAWNRGAEAMYGWTEPEALAMNIRTLVPPEHTSDLDGLLRKLKDGEGVVSFETQRRTKDGRMLDVWLTVTPIRDEAGRVEGGATTERECTALKRAEAALGQRAEELEATNAELERFNKAMVDRELRMIELKQEVNAAHAKAGLPEAYEISQ